MKKTVTHSILAAIKKANREDEIARHGHPVGYKKIQESKKVFSRQREKNKVKKYLSQQ
ncbi:MAG: hypothetical protein PHD21_02675 [Flavobacteriales bacterium]|nr:hypothetical protein [Flavobacteriales bacterium]